MPYRRLSEANPAIRGIRPRVTLAQANLIARWADRIERGGGAESPWAVAIAQFKKAFRVEGGRWVRRKRKEAAMGKQDWEVQDVEGADAALAKGLAEILSEYDEAEEKGLITGPADPVYVPFGVKSFAELEAAEEAEEYADTVKQLNAKLVQIHRNILNDPDEGNKPAALKAAVDEYAVRVERAPDAEKAKWTRAFVNDLPDSSFLYVEPGGKKDGEGRTVPRSLRHFPYKDAAGKVDLPHLRNAISRLGQPKTGGKWRTPLSASLRKRLLGRARRVLRRAQGAKALDDLASLGIDVAADLLGDLKGLVADATKALVGKEREPQGGFFAYKDTETGTWRWLGVYSNKFRDDDEPPEIIAEAAHKEFHGAVDAGLWPFPELWLWHVEGTRAGVADVLAWDDRGFAVAGGAFDEGKERVAAALAAQEGLRVSHGMPTEEIRRDEGDPTVIVRYRTREISPLPARAAANRLTAFGVEIKGGEKGMGLPDDKREFLAGVMGEEAVAELEDGIAGQAKAAVEAGLEFKETEPGEEAPVTEPTEPAEPAEPTEPAEPAEPTEPTEPTETSEEVEEGAGEEAGGEGGEEGLTAQAIAEEVGKAIKEVFQPLSERVAALEQAASAEKASDEARIAAAVDGVPAASLSSIIMRTVVGDEATRVANGDPLAKDRPPEAEAAEDSIGIPLIDAIQRGKDWRSVMGIEAD